MDKVVACQMKQDIPQCVYVVDRMITTKAIAKVGRFPADTVVHSYRGPHPPPMERPQTQPAMPLGEPSEACHQIRPISRRRPRSLNNSNTQNNQQQQLLQQEKQQQQQLHAQHQQPAGAQQAPQPNGGQAQPPQYLSIKGSLSSHNTLHLVDTHIHHPSHQLHNHNK